MQHPEEFSNMMKCDDMEKTTDDTDKTEEDSMCLSENLYIDPSTKFDCTSPFLPTSVVLLTISVKLLKIRYWSRYCTVYRIALVICGQWGSNICTTV